MKLQKRVGIGREEDGENGEGGERVEGKRR